MYIILLKNIIIAVVGVTIIIIILNFNELVEVVPTKCQFITRLINILNTYKF